MDGDDPVIQSDKFHIGTDEYDKAYGEQMRKWTDELIKYVNSKGYESRVWASLGKNGFNGTTPVTNEATMNLWAPYWADVQETYDAGYDIMVDGYTLFLLQMLDIQIVSIQKDYMKNLRSITLNLEEILLVKQSCQ